MVFVLAHIYGGRIARVRKRHAIRGILGTGASGHQSVNNNSGSREEK
jgi:hypothetical protein